MIVLKGIWKLPLLQKKRPESNSDPISEPNPNPNPTPNPNLNPNLNLMQAWLHIDKVRDDAKLAMRKMTAGAEKREIEHGEDLPIEGTLTLTLTRACLEDLHRLKVEKEVLEKELTEAQRREGKLQKELEVISPTKTLQHDSLSL